MKNKNLALQITNEVAPVNKVASIDYYYGVWDDINDALSNIPDAIREVGRQFAVYTSADKKTVNIYKWEKDTSGAWVYNLTGKDYTLEISAKLDKSTTDVATADSTWKYAYLTDVNNNTRRVLVTALEKNIGNTNMSLTASRTLATNSFPFFITGKPNKASDSTFVRPVVEDTNGQQAYIDNGYNMLKSIMTPMTEAQKLELANLLGANLGSSGQPSVNLISPPIVQSRFNSVEYVLLRGANLYLNSSSMSVEILASDKTTVIATIPNSQVQLYSDGTQLIFYYNFYNWTAGQYFIKITSGLKTYITTLDLKIVESVTDIPLDSIQWEILKEEGITETTTSASGRNFNIITPNTAGDIPKIVVKSQELFAQGEDFYIEFKVVLGTRNGGASDYRNSYIGLGYSSTPISLSVLSLVHLKFSTAFTTGMTYSNNETLVATNSISPVDISVVIIKTGNLFRTIIGNTNYSTTLSNNSGYSLSASILGRTTSQTIQGQIVKAFKFN